MKLVIMGGIALGGAAVAAVFGARKKSKKTKTEMTAKKKGIKAFIAAIKARIVDMAEQRKTKRRRRKIDVTVERAKLESMISEAENMDLSLYTNESADKLRSAADEAKVIMEQNIEDLFAKAADMIANAIAELCKKPVDVAFGRVLKKFLPLYCMLFGIAEEYADKDDRELLDALTFELTERKNLAQELERGLEENIKKLPEADMKPSDRERDYYIKAEKLVCDTLPEIKRLIEEKKAQAIRDEMTKIKKAFEDAGLYVRFYDEAEEKSDFLLGFKPQTDLPAVYKRDEYGNMMLLSAKGRRKS